MFSVAMLNVHGAMLCVTPNVEIRIYSTCNRISQKLMCNVQKFFGVICNDDVAGSGFSVVRRNMGEMVLKGPVSLHEVLVVNSYPSMVPPSRST